MDSEKSSISGKITSRLIIVIATICLGSNFQYYSNSVVNNLSTICQQWMNQSYHDHYGSYLSSDSLNVLWSFSAAALQMGGLTGALFTRLLADKFGRRRALATVSLSCVVGSLFEGAAEPANSFEIFILGRYLIGVGLGCGMPIASMLITEIAPVKYRGACGSTQQMMSGFGNVVSFVFTLSHVLGTQQWWPVTVSLPPFITSLFQIFVLSFYAHDSPKFLIMAKGDVKKGLKALEFYQGKDGADLRLQAINSEKEALEKQQESEQEKFHFVDLFLRPETRKPLVVALLIAFGAMMCGSGAVLAYSKTMFTEAGLSNDDAQYASLGVGVINCLTPLLTMFVVEKTGRKSIMLFGLGVCEISLIALTLCVAGSNRYDWPDAPMGAMVCLYVFQVGYGMIGSIMLIAPAELFPQKIRASAMTVVFCWLWTLQLLCVLGYLPFSQWVGVTYSYFPFIACVTLDLVLLALLMPETKGKTTEQVAAMFANKAIFDLSIDKRTSMDKF